MIISFSAIIVRASHVSPGTAATLRCAYALPILGAWGKRRPCRALPM